MKAPLKKGLGFANAGVFVVAAVVVLSGVLVWLYISKSTQFATTEPPVKTTAQAVSSARQVKEDLNNIDIDKELDMSEIDAVLQ